MLAMACCSSLAIIAPEWIGPAPWASRGSDATLKQYAPILCVPPSCVEAPLGLHRYRSSRGHPGPEPRVPTTSERRRVAAAYKPRTSIECIATCATSWLLPRGSILPTDFLSRGVAINSMRGSGGIFQLLYTARAIEERGHTKGPDRSAKKTTTCSSERSQKAACNPP